MQLLTERGMVRRFISEFFPKKVEQHGWGIYFWSKDKQRELLSLVQQLDPETASADDINEILGQRYLQPDVCTECKTKTWDLVQLGENPEDNSESYTASVCLSCLEKACEQIKANR